MSTRSRAYPWFLDFRPRPAKTLVQDLEPFECECFWTWDECRCRTHWRAFIWTNGEDLPKWPEEPVEYFKSTTQFRDDREYWNTFQNPYNNWGK